ncbi:hypothetical protein [Haladaptatus sp. GCM10025893]|uniref:hypothetical protein n=1 Tax=Haladaptatus sp. GCM10025893 TaxID=3252659 RepID=UPI00361709DF
MATSIETGGTIIDDFEDGDLSEYSFNQGASGASVVTSPTKHGSEALEIDGTNTEMISTAGLTYYPAVGDTFRCWVRATGGADEMNLSYGVQNHENRYFVSIDFANDTLKLYRYQSGSSTLLDEQTSGFTLSEDAWYEVKVEWKNGGSHRVTLFDNTTSLTATTSATDLTWSSGGIGYDAYLATGGTVYIDYVTIDGSDTYGITANSTIDGFEDGDLSEYSFNQGASGASVVTSPVFSGTKVLEIDGTNTEMISTTGLSRYPEAGERFSYWIRTTDGAEDINLSYGVQDHDNRYYIRVDVVNNDLILSRYESGIAYQLASDSSGYTLSEDSWYEIEVAWAENGHHKVTLYDNSRHQVARVSAVDVTWLSGGIGYDAYLATGGTVYIDHIDFKGAYRLQNTHIVDDFEDGDLSEYSFNQGASGASVVTSPVFSGTKVLEIDGTNTEMISTTGLYAYPAVGNTFSYWIRTTDGAEDINLSYGVQDHDNRYYIRVDVVNNDLILSRYEDATTYQLASDSSGYTLSEDSWYEIEVEWRGDGRHIVTLYDDSTTEIARVSATDLTWSSGGIGYDAYLATGGTVYIDYVHMGGAGRLPSDVTITGNTGDGSAVSYEFTVSGEVTKGRLADGGESVGNGVASGGVADGGQDSFKFSGDLTRFTAVDLELEVDWANHTITVTDTRSSPSTAAGYEFTVSGDLTPLSSTENDDSVNEGTATGSVNGDIDAYEFTGDLVKITLNSSVIVDIQSAYPRLASENSYPNASVRDLAIDMAEDPTYDGSHSLRLR